LTNKSPYKRRPWEKSITDLSSITTVGLDLAKHVFQVHGVDASGCVVVAKAIRRNKLLEFFASLPPCLVGLEASGSAHHWARELIKLGHDARMMPPAYVKPYIRRQKNDASDAAAICEAVTRPSMRFVAVRSLMNQAALMRHKAREMLVTQRTQLLNGLRGHLTEVGVIAPQGLRFARELAELIEACDETIPFEVCEALAPLVVQLRNLDEAIARLDRIIAKLAQKDETTRRLMSIPGFGPITASAMAATIQDTSSFAGPREFAAFLGLTPKQNSSGGKPKLGRISKMGNRYFAQTAGRGRPCGAVSPQAAHRPAADVGEEADRQEALQACRCGARQQDGAHRLRNPAGQDSLSGNSGVRSIARVRSRGSPRAQAA
jgi:transposase